jgi:hypothetical protein
LSQIYKPLTSSGPIPPIIPTSFVTQDGTAVPLANVLLIDGLDSSENNDNGIISKGGVVGTGTSNEVDIVLTNRITGTATTTDNVTPQTLSSFSLGLTPATFLLEIRIVAYNVTDSLSAGYTSTSTIRTTGAAGTEIDAAPGIISEEGAMSGVIVQNQIVGNTVEIEVTGLAGKTINWKALTTYIEVT